MTPQEIVAQAVNFLKEEGYDVWRVKHYCKRIGTRFFHQKVDIFGCDVVAMKEGEIRFIQVTKDKHIRRRIDVFREFKWYRGVQVELWQKMDREWKIYVYDLEKGELLHKGMIRRGKLFMVSQENEA